MILVVGDEDVFAELEGRFAPRGGKVYFAASVDVAGTELRRVEPQLVVVPEEPAGEALQRFVTDAHGRRALILGLARRATPRPAWADGQAICSDLPSVTLA